MYRLILYILIIVSASLNGQSTKSYYRMLDREIEKSVPLVSVDDLHKLLSQKSQFVLLDTREQSEYNVSHIPGAHYAGYNNFSLSSLPSISIDETIVVYCSIGYRSEKIGERLKSMGYKNVYNLYGGVFDWINNEKELVNKKNYLTSKIHPYDQNWGRWLIKGEKVYE